jgi:hypothetical protein
VWSAHQLRELYRKQMQDTPRPCARAGCPNEVTGHLGRKYCDDLECVREVRRQRERGRVRKPSGAKAAPCSGGCGRTIWLTSTSAESPVCQECRAKLRQRTCEQCGEQFEASASTSEQRFCSTECANKFRRLYDNPKAASKASVRARKVLVRQTRDYVSDQQIWERDGWICMIPGCGLPIDPELKWPDPSSASIDHIIPRTRGGDHLPDWDSAHNKRSAHLICNIRRGDRMHPDDLQILTPQLVASILPPKLRPPKPAEYCIVCQSAEVRSPGSTCEGCRTAARASLQQRIWQCRSDGLTWEEIADQVGLSGAGAAYNVGWAQIPGQVFAHVGAAVAVAAAPQPCVNCGLPEHSLGHFMKCVSGKTRTRARSDQEDPLWWTSVRPSVVDADRVIQAGRKRR